MTGVVFPRLVTAGDSGSGHYTGFAVASLAPADTVLTFTAFDTSGRVISGPNITNPKSLPLGRGKQIARIDYEIFGNGLPAKQPVGWISLASTTRRIAGFFLMFDGNLTILDGADVSTATMSSFVLPEIEEQVVTQICVANPSLAPATVTIELVGPDGKARTAGVVQNLNARGSISMLLSSLFPGIAPVAGDYIRVTSDRGVVGFQYLGKSERYAAGLNGQDATAGAAVLYAPQYAVGRSWHSTLSVINLDYQPGEITFRLVNDGGVQAGTTRTLAIPARGKILVTDRDFFLDPGDSLIQGYVEIRSNGPKLTGSVVFGDPGRATFSASLPLVSSPRSAMVFGQIASNAEYYTGIALVNFTGANETVHIEAFGSDGDLLASAPFAIPAGARMSQLLTQYFPGLRNREIGSGYIRITSDRGLAGFALFGTHRGTVLAAVPPQAAP